jgi:protein phosphatase
MSILVATQTDIGLKRAQNEDHHGSWISDQDPEHVVLVIADGMGGAQAGEIASHMAVEHVLDETRAAEPNANVENLRRVVEGANRLIHAASLAQSDRRGMGTTCTAVVLHGANATFAHVGDSRLYLIRNREIRQITRDHSLVAQLLEANHLTPEEARSDPRRNVVTRSVGVGESVEVDGGTLALAPGDTLLLSTDGLHGLASDAELATHAQGPDLERACRDLVELARSRGGHDNITVVLARMEGGA